MDKQQQYTFPEQVTTGDGSSSLIHSHLKEMYHSRHGAWTEANYIFIEKGLIPVLELGKSPVRVFEMGFGSGLNAARTRETAREKGVEIHYTTIEKYPVDPRIVEEMNFPFPDEKDLKKLTELHYVPWNCVTRMDSYFSLHKISGSFPEDLTDMNQAFDLIYYDAFAPVAQPELWEENVFKLCFDMLIAGGVWITFSSKSSVQRNLASAGFLVEKLPGPPGKREIIRALKPRKGSAE